MGSTYYTLALGGWGGGKNFQYRFQKLIKVNNGRWNFIMIVVSLKDDRLL